MEDQGFHFSFRICILGDTGVGKSTLVGRQTHSEEILKEQSNALGIHIITKSFKKDDKTYQVQYWDAPGNDASMRKTARFCAGSAGIILVFDVQNAASFDHISDWMREIEHNGEHIPRILVGNKADGEVREVQTGQAQAFASKHNMPYIETSAAGNIRVREVFTTLFQYITAAIPSPAEPSLLMALHIRVGKKLADSASYRKALYAPPPGSVATVDM